MKAYFYSMKLFFLILFSGLFLFAQMISYVTKEFWGFGFSWDLLQYCISNFSRNSQGYAIIQVLVNSLIAFSLGSILWRTVKQIVMARKWFYFIEQRKNHSLTHLWIEKYRDMEGKLYVIHDNQFVAVTIGFFRPKIVISTFVLEHFTQREIEAILFHEWKHYKGKDPFKYFIVKLIVDSILFLPVVKDWSQYYFITKEIIADHYAMARLGSSFEIGSALMKIIQLVKNEAFIDVGHAYFVNRALKHRIDHIIDPNKILSFPWFRYQTIIPSILMIYVLISLLHQPCA